MILQSNYKPLETISPDDEVSDGTSWIVALTLFVRGWGLGTRLFFVDWVWYGEADLIKSSAFLSKLIHWQIPLGRPHYISTCLYILISPWMVFSWDLHTTSYASAPHITLCAFSIGAKYHPPFHIFLGSLVWRAHQGCYLANWHLHHQQKWLVTALEHMFISQWSVDSYACSLLKLITHTFLSWFIKICAHTLL